MGLRLQFLMVFAILASLLPLDSYGSSSPQVKVDTGTIEGSANGPVRSFLGIPYAAPPVGELRWKPPAPAAKWKRVRAATEFGSRCMQARIYSDMVFRDPGINEDCLYLNVWTPAKNAKADRRRPDGPRSLVDPDRRQPLPLAAARAAARRRRLPDPPDRVVFPEIARDDVPYSLFYQWTIRELAGLLECEPTPDAVHAARRKRGLAWLTREIAARQLQDVADRHRLRRRDDVRPR